MTKEELHDKLNEEYKDIGVISIKEMELIDVQLKDVSYVVDVMNKIEPLDIDEPIVLAKHWDDTYNIIDGYHRVKSKLNKKDTLITAYVLDDFIIKRKSDNLFSFLETTVDKKITFLTSNLLKVGDKHFQIIENEGCGGCSSGWSNINVFQKYINKPIVVKKIESDGKEESDEYRLLINGEHIADVDTGWGNGYYGGDFKVHLII